MYRKVLSLVPLLAVLLATTMIAVGIPTADARNPHVVPHPCKEKHIPVHGKLVVYAEVERGGNGSQRISEYGVDVGANRKGLRLKTTVTVAAIHFSHSEAVTTYAACAYEAAGEVGREEANEAPGGPGANGLFILPSPLNKPKYFPKGALVTVSVAGKVRWKKVYPAFVY